MTTASGVVPLEINHLTFSYGKKRKNSRMILDDVNLIVHPGEIVAVMGPSGCGKSTLLSLLLGLLKPHDGVIRIAGQPVKSGTGSQASLLRRRHIGMVFQSGYLLDELTPIENVMLPALAHHLSPARAQERAHELLERLDLEASQRPTATLSGGEQQRVAIARALMNDPEMLIADEPTASLDSANRTLVMEYLKAQVHNSDRGLLVVTHDDAVSAEADRIFTLSKGHLIQESS